MIGQEYGLHSADIELSQNQRQNWRIRKLTPLECGRLMGVKDEDCEKLAQNQSNSGLYHIFGDSIVTTVLMAIFGEMLGIDWEQKLPFVQGITDTPNEQGGTTDEV